MITSDYYTRRQSAIELLGGVCVRCRTTNELEFDHIDPSKKSYDINKILTCRPNILMPELTKCQLLCRNCHHKKTLSEIKPFVHGTSYSWMKKKCSCELCLEAKRIWSEARNARRRGSKGYAKGPYSKDPPHGSSAKYSRGCRCDACRLANTTKERKRKLAKSI